MLLNNSAAFGMPQHTGYDSYAVVAELVDAQR